MTHYRHCGCSSCKDKPSWWQPWMKEALEMFSDGRHIFYEGDDPAQFIFHVKQQYDLDIVALCPNWAKEYAEFKSFSFDCPGHLYGVLYLSGIYPMGS